MGNITEVFSQDPAANERSKKIFVGGLSPTSKEDDVSAYFSAYGHVSWFKSSIHVLTNSIIE